MKPITRSGPALLLMAAFFTAIFTGFSFQAQADEAAEKIIQARQGFYRMVVHNAGTLFAMAKEDRDYDAAAASTAANNLLLLSQINNDTLWPAGTSKEEMPGKTRALKKIWDTYPAIGEKAEAWKKAIADMAQVAGNGLGAVQSKIGALGGSCKGCHDNFRAEKF